MKLLVLVLSVFSWNALAQDAELVLPEPNMTTKYTVEQFNGAKSVSKTVFMEVDRYTEGSYTVDLKTVVPTDSGDQKDLANRTSLINLDRGSLFINKNSPSEGETTGYHAHVGFFPVGGDPNGTDVIGFDGSCNLVAAKNLVCEFKVKGQDDAKVVLTSLTPN